MSTNNSDLLVARRTANEREFIREESVRMQFTRDGMEYSVYGTFVTDENAENEAGLEDAGAIEATTVHTDVLGDEDAVVAAFN